MELALPMTEEDWNFQEAEPSSGRVLICVIESSAVLIVNVIVRALSLPVATRSWFESLTTNGRGADCTNGPEGD